MSLQQLVPLQEILVFELLLQLLVLLLQVSLLQLPHGCFSSYKNTKRDVRPPKCELVYMYVVACERIV